jgi:CofD-related protein of GAK system
MEEGQSNTTGIVFLSGGSALQGLAGHLAARGDHATHVISVFDSGGSAGRLREVCDGIAIGDIRKRLTAIGNRERADHRPIVDLFSSRLPRDRPVGDVRRTVEAAAEGEGELMSGLHNGAAVEVSEAFARLLEKLPEEFDWCDGSVGNLILSGRYRHLGDWSSTLRWAHARLGTRGSVVPVSTAGAQLGARLRNGREVVGQARITSESEPIEEPIDELRLIADDGEEGIEANEQALAALRQARAIVYAWGSFYTSVLPSLLVDDVAAAVRSTPVPKVLLLNPVRDSETRGRTSAELVRELRRYSGGSNGDAVTHVVALRTPDGVGLYRRGDRAELQALGVEVLEMDSPAVPGPPQIAAVADALHALA